MVDYKQVLRLRAEGVSQRGIADVLGCSRNTVAAVFAAANAAGIGFEQMADLAADEVRHLLLPEPVKTDRLGPGRTGFRACPPGVGTSLSDAAVVVERIRRELPRDRRGAVPVFVLQRTVPPLGHLDRGIDAGAPQPGRVHRG